MKHKLAKIANSILLVFASVFVFTNSIFAHRPETPEELLKK
ncbi:cyclic lactone autoinducer peptide [Paenibacillus elgii]